MTLPNLQSLPETLTVNHHQIRYGIVFPSWDNDRYYSGCEFYTTDRKGAHQFRHLSDTEKIMTYLNQYGAEVEKASIVCFI